MTPSEIEAMSNEQLGKELRAYYSNYDLPDELLIDRLTHEVESRLRASIPRPVVEVVHDGGWYRCMVNGEHVYSYSHHNAIYNIAANLRTALGLEPTTEQGKEGEG